MLIEGGKLNTVEFKDFFPNISWRRLPRVLGPNHSEYFYSGRYEDSNKIVEITVRPSKIMAVSETFKNRMLNDGSVPPEGYKGQTNNWGASVEIRVDDSFIQKLIEAAKPMPPRENQVLTWE